MDDLAYFQNLRANKQADDHTLYLLGKLCKEQGLYTEALSVFGELMLKQNEALNDRVLREIAEISALRSTGITGVSAGSEPPGEQTPAAETPDSASGEESGEAALSASPPGEEQSPPALRLVGGSGSAGAPRTAKKDVTAFRDVGGLDALKKTIEMKIIKPFQSPEIFAKFRKKSGGGLLLYGPPGCGKTFIAKATAGECRAYFRSVSITDILGPYTGESERNMRDIFSSARARKPCVLFFDEIDTLGFNRLKAGSMSARGIVDQLLTEIEGIDSSTDKLLIIGATNMPWDVDDALRRPGRFDRSVFVPPPDQEAREAIFRLKLADRPAEPLDYGALAKKSPFFSGADIEHVVELAAERVLEEILRTGRQELKISQRVLMETLSAERPSTLGWLKTIGDYVRYANQTGFYNEVETYLRENKL
ncbi:MAG: ATP-binding protein [Clostridiales Family XIII bacterium]|jgi:AAA+ superfamily predicted ATPase|nr:ATP-binding protein [Clostridiales Family XIII bacterium]